MPFKEYWYCPKCNQVQTLKDPVATDTYSDPIKYHKYRKLSRTVAVNAIPANHRKLLQHFQLSSPDGNAVACQQYLHYLCTEDIIAQGPTPSSIAQKAKNKIKGNGVQNIDQGVVCVMYDHLTQKWFYGSSGSATRAYAHIPTGFLQSIPNNNNPEIASYGRGCAEVDAVNKAFGYRANNGHAGNTSLSNCVFAARNKNNVTLRAMCNNCQKWLLNSPIGGQHCKAIDANGTVPNNWY